MYYSVFKRSYQSQRQVWVVQITLDSGKRITRKIDDCSVIDAGEANEIGKAIYKKIRRKILAQKYPGAFEGEYEPSTLTVSGLYEKYKKSLYANDTSHNTIRTYDAAINTLLSHCGDVMIIELSVEHFRQWRTGLLSMVKNSTINKYHQKISSLLNWAITEGDLNRNVWSEHKLLNEDPRAHKVIPFEHIQRFFATMADPVCTLFFSIMYFTGSRPSEVLALTYENIYIEDDIPTIQLPNIKSKKKRMKVLPLHPTLVEIISQHVDSNGRGRVFSRWKASNGITSTGRVFKKICKRAGLPSDYSQTWLRHSLSTALQSRGVPQQVVSRILDHSSQTMTDQYYTHLGDLKTISEAINRMPALLTHKTTNVDS